MCAEFLRVYTLSESLEDSANNPTIHNVQLCYANELHSKQSKDVAGEINPQDDICE